MYKTLFSVHYVQDGLDGIPRILVDPNTLRADGTTSLKFEEPSNNGEILSYGLSSKGSDWTTVHFKNVTNGQEFPETLKFTKWPNVQWSKDDSGVYYSVSDITFYLAFKCINICTTLLILFFYRDILIQKMKATLLMELKQLEITTKPFIFIN